MKTIFISYSWGSDQHQAWVKKFSDDLQARLGEGFKVLLDQNQRKGTSLSRFMKKGLKEADKVLIIGTPKYKEKSEASGGVAYETMVITNEMMSDMDTTKFYPILRSGTFETSFPTDIKDRIGDDFSDDTKYNVNLQIVVKALIEELSPKVPHSKETKGQDNLIFSVGNVSFKMIRVEGGTFMMGANEYDNDAIEDEKPAHQVTLSNYYIGETEVTQALWEAVMNENPSLFDGANRPVENVSWYDCREFIKELNIVTGKKFRLPTEAEWEFAARGGKNNSNYIYSGSNNIDDVAWYADKTLDKDKDKTSADYGTHDVKTKDANELGIYDMSGNVWEWCSDRYDPKYYSKAQSPLSNPKGPQVGTNRVHRGGSWNRKANYCRLSYRGGIIPNRANNNLGLRLALSE